MLFIDNVFRTLAYIMLWMIMNCFYYFLKDYSQIKYPMLTLTITWFFLWIGGLLAESFQPSPRAWSWNPHRWQILTVCFSWACMLVSQSTIFSDPNTHPAEHINKYGIANPIFRKNTNPQCTAGDYAMHIKQFAPIFVFLLTTIIRKHYYGSLRKNYWYTLGILTVVAVGAIATMGRLPIQSMADWKVYLSTAVWLLMRASWLVSLDSLRRAWPAYTLTQLYSSIGWIMTLVFATAFVVLEYSTLMGDSNLRNLNIHSDGDIASYLVVLLLSIVFFVLFFHLNLLMLRSLESVVHYSIFVTIRDVFWAFACITFSWINYSGLVILFFGITAYETKVGKSIIQQWNRSEAARLKLHQENIYISDEDSDDDKRALAYIHTEDEKQN